MPLKQEIFLKKSRMEIYRRKGKNIIQMYRLFAGRRIIMKAVHVYEFKIKSMRSAYICQNIFKTAWIKKFK